MKTGILRFTILLAMFISALMPAGAARASTIVVINLNDSGAGSLRAVLAGAGVGDTITFDAALTGGTIHLASTLTLTQNVTIDGSALASPITISGDTDNDTVGDVGVFAVNSGVTTAFNNLTITKGDALDGGGIANKGTLTVNHVNFIDNIADNGGAIDNTGGTLTVNNSTFTNNYAYQYGGGIENNGALTVANSTFSGNAADDSGGGIENYGSGVVMVSNSTFYDNRAAFWGGGIENGGILTVTNSTFSANSALGSGGGMDSYLGILNYSNTILSDSPSGGDCVNTAALGTNTHNLVEDGSCSASLTGDPKLGALADNGGPTLTMSLLADSPAINAADDTTCAAAPINNLDQRGIVRPYGLHCDIGSYEVGDSTAPAVLSINRVSVNPVNSANVDFTLTFSEAVTGVDTTAPFSDFILTTSGVSGAAVSGVSGSGSVYTVTVSTGTGSGTLRLDVADNDTIMDLSSNPLGGAGAANGDFAAGQSYNVRTTTFGDVPEDYWAWHFIERLSAAGVTGGCGNGNYCPTSTVTRAQMAIFLLRGVHGSSYAPPAVGAGTGFADVPVDHPSAAWIKQLAAEGITGGCGVGLYCPDAVVTRAQMAIFLLRSKYTSAYTPPAANGDFTDVPISHLAAAWVEQLAAEGITGGCGVGIYCPDNTVTRDQMAIFLVRTFNLP